MTWDEAGEFAEAPTTVDASGAVPEAIEDEPTTVSRCAECGQRCIVGGPIAPTLEAMAYASPYECARGSSDTDAWLWCVSHPGTWRLVRYQRR